MTFLGGEYVGPTLGASSGRAGLAASAGGLALVSAFMLAYYRRAGVNAVFSVVANLAVLLGLMAAVGAALTLPGIAGLILTIGMGVDSHVLIFGRIKEELRAGRTLRRAVAAGFDRVFLTLLDTHVTLVAAAFLFQFGSGAIRGFATMLTLGLLRRHRRRHLVHGLRGCAGGGAAGATLARRAASCRRSMTGFGPRGGTGHPRPVAPVTTRGQAIDASC